MIGRDCTVGVVGGWRGGGLLIEKFREQSNPGGSNTIRRFLFILADAVHKLLVVRES